MKDDRYCDLIGTSSEMIALKDEIERIAQSDAKILVTGESGVGKELVARRIHKFSRRATGPFVAVNCAGLPETLLASELFGHVKGSFTGAYRDRPGQFEVADQGTVFLDEIGEMTLRMQGLLLRFLETGELQKVGTDRNPRTVDVRIVSATNRTLREMIAQGTFREDLFYRLDVIHLEIPPLRQHKEDLPQLIEHFLKRFNRNGDFGARTLDPDVTGMLMDYPWPGNVRELENAIEHLVVTSRTDVIQVGDVPRAIRTPRAVAVRPKKERRRTVTDDLYKLVIDGRESFWTSVYPMYMRRDITRANVRDLVRRVLKEARGNYKIVTRLFNLEPQEYKKLLNFLRAHDCHVPFKEYR